MATRKTIATQVHRAMQDGERMQESVRAITLGALARGRLDRKAMRNVMRQAFAAIEAAAAAGVLSGIADAAQQRATQPR